MPQIPSRFQDLINRQLKLYESKRTFEVRDSIPPANDIPLDSRLHWFKIPGVISVFVDMKGSTQLSARRRVQSTAGAYQLFTGTAVDLFHRFDAPYIDVRGDGVFALFNQDQAYRAFAAALTFKTFADDIFVPHLKNAIGRELGAHIGIDQETVLVHRIGLKRSDDRTDRQNEVWAGKPVNMSSKLAAAGEAGELCVSDRYFRNINHELTRLACGCSGKKKNPWTQVNVKKDPKFGFNFDFNIAYCLKSCWCKKHGEGDCDAIMALDKSAKTHAN